MDKLIALIVRGMRTLADWLEPTPESAQFTESYLMFGDWLR